LELQNHTFFISADDWPPSYPSFNSAEERTPPTLLIEGAMGFRAGLGGEKPEGFP